MKYIKNGGYVYKQNARIIHKQSLSLYFFFVNGFGEAVDDSNHRTMFILAVQAKK